MNWNAMATAPRDGTPIIVLYSDFGGVDLVRWGESEDGNHKGWFNFDFNDIAGDSYLGWIPVPDTNNPMFSSEWEPES